jgi:hypothetical protein
MPSPNSTHSRLARAMIWSIQYQDRISHFFRLYLTVAVVIVSFMGVVGLISLDAVLRSFVYGGLLLSIGLWCLIVKRRAWLLALKDPELKRQAYSAMLTYLALKGYFAHRQEPETSQSEKEGECTTC